MGLENVRKTLSGDVVLVKRPHEINEYTMNVCLDHEEYEYLVHNQISRIEILRGNRRSTKYPWDPTLLQFAQLRKGYYLVPYSKKSKLVKLSQNDKLG